jgi:hypothetical protein
MGMECISSSDQDAAAGTGAKTVRIYYLKSDYTEATTDVILTGQTAVATSVTDIFRVNNFRILDFGSGGTNYKAAGNIDVRHVNDTPIYSRILTGQTRARNSIYTVPENKTLYVVNMAIGTTKASTTGTVATFTLRATYDDKTSALLQPGLFFMPYAELNHQDGSFVREFDLPLHFPEHTDIKVSVICGQSATICTTSTRGWLE